MGKMTGKSYGPTEMIIRGLPGAWLAWFAGGWGDPIPPGKQGLLPWVLVAGIRGRQIRW